VAIKPIKNTIPMPLDCFRDFGHGINNTFVEKLGDMSQLI